MTIRFHTNLDGEPHVRDHNVSEDEVIEVLNRPLEVSRGRDDSFIALGRTRAGRLLKVIYTDARDGEGVFVITAFDLPAKQSRAMNRRLRRRRQS